MYKIKRIAVSLTIAMSLHACYSMNYDVTEGVSSPQDVTATIEQYDYTNVQDFEKYTATRLREIDREIDIIQGHLNSADSATQRTLQGDLKELKAQRNFLENQVLLVDNVSENEWDRFKLQISGLFNSFLETFTNFQIKVDAALNKKGLFKS